MSQRILRSRVELCRICDSLLSRQSPAKYLFRTQKIQRSTSRQLSTSRRARSQSVQVQGTTGAGAVAAKLSEAAVSTQKTRILDHHATHAELEEALQQIKAACSAIIARNTAPSEQETRQIIGQCDALAKLLVYEPLAPSPSKTGGAASALLSLEETTARKLPRPKIPMASQHMINELSDLAYQVIKHPPVFIAPSVLDLYVSTQASLGKPKTFPEVFSLYANKAVPQEGTSPVRYAAQNPNKVSNAISTATANRALQSAIDAKQLAVAMDIIDTSYATKAFHRAKFIRVALLPTTGLAVAPIAAYTVASQLALLQTTMDAQMATNVAFAGILAYVGFTATIGVVAITTANDQMDRVTWAPGIPLRERWIREEERAAIDKIAGAWGFRESWRRGEEEGEDWDILREWVGRRGMMLDRVELMDGME